MEEIGLWVYWESNLGHFKTSCCLIWCDTWLYTIHAALLHAVWITKNGMEQKRKSGGNWRNRDTLALHSLLLYIISSAPFLSFQMEKENWRCVGWLRSPGIDGDRLLGRRRQSFWIFSGSIFSISYSASFQVKFVWLSSLSPSPPFKLFNVMFRGTSYKI